MAAAADYFYAKRRLGWTVSLFFGTVPVARDGRGLDDDRPPTSTRLFEQGWSLVMFAEGTRSRDGSVGKLRSGAAVLAAQHDLALVPIHVSGTHDVMPVGRYWSAPRAPAPERITLRPPIQPRRRRAPHRRHGARARILRCRRARDDAGSASTSSHSP